MIRKTFIALVLGFLLGSVAYAQHGEFPWQLGRQASPAATPVYTTLPAVGLPDGPAMLRVVDLRGHVWAAVQTEIRSGAMHATLPKPIVDGLQSGQLRKEIGVGGTGTTERPVRVTR